MTTTTEKPKQENGEIAPAATDIVVRNGEPGVYHALDARDEAQVLDELKGKGLKKWAYEFNVGGQKVRGLSYTGVNGVVRDLNARGVARINCPPEPAPQFTEAVDDDGDPVIECMVYARDELTGGGAWGLATQKRFETAYGKERPDRFAKTKALSKAQRNAKKALIPEEMVAEVVAGLTSGQVERVQVPNLAQPAAANGQRATASSPAQRTEKLATPKQRRLIFTRAEQAGLSDRGVIRGIVLYASGAQQTDRIPESKVEDVLERIDDHAATVALIRDEAAAGDEVARNVVDRYLDREAPNAG